MSARWKAMAHLLRAAVLAPLLAAVLVGAVKAEVNEIQVKSAFIYKFISYIDWPPHVFQSPDSALVIGVLGADAIADNLTQIVNAHPGIGRPVVVRKLRSGDSLSDLHMLFIGGSNSGRLGEILAAAKEKSLLTVTESEQALALGSVINFVVVDDKVRFDVAPPPSDPNNLKVSARLLSVARRVVVRPS